MTWALGDSQARAFVGSIKAEKIAQGDQVIWTRVAAKNPSAIAPSNTEVTINWTDDSGIELGFTIQRSLDSSFTTIDGTLSVPSNSSTVTDSGLTHNTLYFYRIKGDYPSGQESDYSTTVSATTRNDVAAPTAVSAAASSNSSISLSWADNSNNEDNFTVERSNSSSGPYTLVTTLSADVTSFEDTGLNYDTTYHYHVRGVNSDGQSPEAYLAATTTNDLLSPSGLTANSLGNSSIQLNWQDNTVNEDGFSIERSLDGTNWTALTSVATNVQSYTDTGLNFNTSYSYKVTAFNSSGNSNSVLASATTSNTLTAPSNLRENGITNSSVILEWDDNSNNEDGFILNAFDLDNNFQSLGTVSLAANVTTYTWGQLVTDRNYAFRVKATNSSGNSSDSNNLSIKTTDTLSDVTAFTAVATSNSTTSLSWTDTSTNKDGFTLERATGNGAFSNLADLAANTTSYSDSNLTADYTYTYRIRSYNSNGTSNFITASVTTNDTLVNITNLNVSGATNQTISLSWVAASNNEDGFTIQRSIGNGAFSHLADLAANTSSYLDSGLSPDTTYNYKVRSYNSNGTSTFITISGITSDTLIAPAIQSVTAPDFDQTVITWSDSNGNEDSFELQFSLNGGSSYSGVPTKTVLNQPISSHNPPGTAQYLHEGLNGATNYQYRIRSVNTSGTSDWSTAVAVTTPAGMLAPSIISGAQSNTSINLSIQDNTIIEDGFTVERSSTSTTSGFTAISTLAANTTSYSNGYSDAGSNLTAGVVYYYRVKADSTQHGDSPYSNVVSVQFDAIAANTTTTSNFIGQNDLGFDFTVTPAPVGSTFIYELSTQSDFSSIDKTFSNNTFLEALSFSDLTPLTTYYVRLRVTGIYSTSSGTGASVTSGAVTTDPCFSASINISDDGDQTQTVTVSGARANSLITIAEYDQSSGIRGSFSTLAEDEDNLPFLGIIRSAQPGGGKITVDGGMLKYVSYLPSSIVSTYGDGDWWEADPPNLLLGGTPQWTTSEETFLTGGGSIYDSSNIPSQWSFLYNNINYLSRSTNKTNKILYINDYKNGLSYTSSVLPNSSFPYYGAHKFYHGFKYISEYAGYTFEQLPVNTGSGNTWLHHNAIETLHNTAQDWTDYFNGYDLVIYVGVNGDSGGHNSTTAYLPQAFIDGFLDFVDGGGGAYITTDHSTVFTVAVNQILSNYGIFAKGYYDRTSDDDAYKVSEILSNTSYIPQGWHPLFSGIDSDSYIYAGGSEVAIEYNTGQDTTNYPIISTTSNHTADASGNATITSHSGGTTIGDGTLFVTTADGCGIAAIPQGATSTWADTGLVEPQSSDIVSSTSVAAITANSGDTDEDSFSDGMIGIRAWTGSAGGGGFKSVGTGPFGQLINDEWYHVAFSQSGNKGILWVNGVAVAIHSSWYQGTGYSPRYSYSSNRFGSVRWGVGAMQHSSWSIDQCFNGVIDQPVFFWDALYQGDVDELYNNSSGLTSSSWSSSLTTKVRFKAEFQSSLKGNGIATGTSAGTYGYLNNINASNYIVGNPSGFTLRVSGPNSARNPDQWVFQPGTGKVSSSGYHPFWSSFNLHDPAAGIYTKQAVWDELNGLTNYGHGNNVMAGTPGTSTKFRTQLAYPVSMSSLHESNTWGFASWFKRSGEGPGKSTALAMYNAGYYANKGTGVNILSCYPYPIAAFVSGNEDTTLYDNYASWAP